MSRESQDRSQELHRTNAEYSMDMSAGEITEHWTIFLCNTTDLSLLTPLNVASKDKLSAGLGLAGEG